MIAIDHVVYAVRDLDRAAERFREELGLDSVPGGRHAGWGTGNRTWVDATGDGARLAQWLGGARLPIRVSDGDAAVTAFGVATTAGDLVVT